MDNFSVKPIFTTTEKIERVANLEIKTEVDIYANDTSFPTTKATKQYVDKKAKVDSSYNPESTNALNGKAVSSALTNYLPLDVELQLELDGGDAAGELDIEYVIDSEISDTSLNPVQNKAIKKYVDNIGGRVDELNEKLIDFIVEEGTLGNWTYRKWKSGVAECWFYGTVIINLAKDAEGKPGSTSIENIYQGGVTLKTPLTFTNKNQMMCLASCNWNFTEWVTGEPNSANEVKIRKFGNGNSFRHKNGAIPDQHNQIVSIYVKGYWK